MTRPQLIIIATLGSLILLGGAFIFQLLGYAPCQMCLWQRWPHAIAIVIGALALVLTRFQMQLAILGALAALTTGFIGLFHSGVELGWWNGPSSCTGGGGLDGVDLLSTDIAPIVMCDEVAWSLFGLSMATYNGVFSLVLVSIWLSAARR